MLRAIQSGSIVVGVRPSPASSLGKWRCSVREYAVSFALISHCSTDLAKSDTRYSLSCCVIFEILRVILSLEWQVHSVIGFYTADTHRSVCCSMRETVLNKPREQCYCYFLCSSLRKVGNLEKKVWSVSEVNLSTWRRCLLKLQGPFSVMTALR